jgi:DUF971 family protein
LLFLPDQYILIGDMAGITPVDITANRQINEMIVSWNDGHTSVYPFTLLRLACPCAQCRGGHENMTSDPDPRVFDLPLVDNPSTRMRNVEGVGSYAITIEWEDGHHYGIYNWDYLRALCPCSVCRGK